MKILLTKPLHLDFRFSLSLSFETCLVVTNQLQFNFPAVGTGQGS